MTPISNRADQPAPNSSGEQQDALPRDELKRRASGGIFIVGSRGLAILLVSFGGTVVVARLLTPRDFGVVAIGASLVLFASVISDGGLGGGLIRRAEPPAREELQALTALQLALTVGLVVATAVIAAPFGTIGWVTALMVSSTPVVALQVPGKILLERSLSYRPLAFLEVSQVLTYHMWAIGLVVAGFGVWGLATATIARAAAGSLIMARVSPVGLVRPGFSWRRIRPLMAFGVRFQAASAMWLVRDQGMNASIAAVASVSTLGLWSLARRLMEIPFLLFDSVWRVSFPTMSRLVANKEDVAPLIERAVAMAAVGTGVVVTGLAGSAPGLIPGLFGEQWRGSSSVVPAACLGLGIGGSVSVATVGYLYAVGDASAVLRAGVLQTIAWFLVTLPLLPVLGVSAVGLGWFVSSVVDAVVLGRATVKSTRVRLVRPLVAPLAVGVFSACVGWVIADRGGASLVSGLAGGACSVLCFHAGLVVFRRQLLWETFRFAAGSMRAATSRRTTMGVAEFLKRG
jgi:O-antigen/teichoic acid export membrane protein